MATRELRVVVFLLFLHSSYGLLTENRGNDFIVGFIAQHMYHLTNGTNRLYLTSDKKTIVRVQAPSISLDRYVLVKPGIPREVELPGKARMGGRTGIERKGIRLSASDKFSVYGMSIVKKSSEGFLGLPVSVLGTDHVISTYTAVISAVMLIVSTADNTRVTIKLKITGGGEVAFGATKYGNGDTISLVINSFEAFQVISDSGQDITGTRVTSDKPVAVYSGNDCAYVPLDKKSCDQLVEQLPPVNLWGTEFVTMTTADRTAGDFFHVIAAYDSTNVFLDRQKVSTLQEGQQYQLDSSYDTSHLLVTSKPCLVVQYAKGFSVDNTQFDPFMSLVPATSQYSNDYTVFVPSHQARRFTGFISVAVNISEIHELRVIPQGNSKSTLSFTQCIAVKGSSYSTCRLNITKDGPCRVFHPNPRTTFALVTYGTSIKESYGFPGGIRIYKSSSNCKRTKMVPADGLDNDCDGRIDEEIFNNIDDDSDGQIDEDLVTLPPSLFPPVNVTIKKCGKINFDPIKLGQAAGESYGVCRARSPENITLSDHYIDKNKCGFTLVRQWKVTDACTNTKKLNQYIFVKIPSKPTVEFPKDRIMICQTRRYLTTDRLGSVKVLRNPCRGSVQVTFKDHIPPPCFTTERSLVREWKVKDNCGRKTTHKQDIRLLPLQGKLRTRNFNVSIVSDVVHKSETSVQSTVRIQNEMDKVLMLSLIGDVYFGSHVLKYRPTYSNASADFLVKFDISSSVLPKTVLENLEIATIIGQLRNVTQRTSHILVEDFNECKSSEYNLCDRNAVCKNNVGSFNCSCVAGFVGNGSICYARPVITNLSHHTEATEGENVTIRCEVFGIPTPEVSWSNPYGDIIKGAVVLHVVEILDDSTTRERLTTQQDDGSLLITDAHMKDSGFYTCIAKNRFGEERKETNLTVRQDQFMVHATVTLIEETFKEDLKKRESLRYRVLEKDLRTKLSALFAKTKGFKQVEIVQFIKGSVKALFRVVMKKDKSGDSANMVKKQIGELLRKKVATGYIGKLKVSKAAELRGRPPAPINPTSSDIQFTSVNVHWDPPDLHDMYRVSLYSLQYKEFGEGVQKWKTFATVPALRHKLSDLEPGSSYMVRVKAHNDYGLSDPSELLEIKTIKGRSNIEWVVLILVPILVFIIIIFLIICIVRIVRKKRRGGAYDPAAREEIAMINCTDTTPTLQTLRTRNHTFNKNDHYTGEPSSYNSTPEKQVGLLTGLHDQYSWRVLPRDRIALGDALGEGEFGLVFKGIFTEDDGEEIPCAVKKLERSATETDLKNLLNELEIMASVGKHENIISLIGACPTGGPLLAVVEYAEHGNLLRYLRRHRRQNYDNMNDYSIEISAANRLKFACEISKGMAHLTLMKCLHRDLATRNVLLGERLVAKVSDFGLSRDVYADNVYEKKTAGILPARWMPIESLELGLYSSASDVWSFGVVLWEIETGGATPFASYSVAEIIEHLKAGRRLGRPSTCSRNLYSIMMRCWNANPQKRPSFDELIQELKDLYRLETMYVNVKGINEDDNMIQQKSNSKPEEC